MMSDQIPSNDNLQDFLTCERLDVDLYRGRSKDLATGQVFGGQVLGQAIQAASDTIDDGRSIHSAHAYFLLKGDVEAPIFYDVDRSMDGRSLSSRRVVARQHGKQILTLSASFQKDEVGLEYTAPADLPLDSLERLKRGELTSSSTFQEHFLEIYHVPEEHLTKQNSVQIWIKTRQSLPDDPVVHNVVLAYVSDLPLLFSTVVPHGLKEQVMEDRSLMILNSIDHAIWFHQPYRVDNWFLYECEAIATGSGRGLAQGRLYTSEGDLFATSQQEGLLRTRRKK